MSGHIAILDRFLLQVVHVVDIDGAQLAADSQGVLVDCESSEAEVLLLQSAGLELPKVPLIDAI